MLNKFVKPLPAVNDPKPAERKSTTPRGESNNLKQVLDEISKPERSSSFRSDVSLEDASAPKSRIDALNAELLLKTEAARNAESQAAELRRVYAQLEQSVVQLKTDHKRDISEREDTLRALQNEIRRLEESLQIANQERATMSQTIVRLRMQLTESQARVEELQGAVEQNERLNKHVQELTDERAFLKEQLAAAHSAMAELQAERDQASDSKYRPSAPVCFLSCSSNSNKGVIR